MKAIVLDCIERKTKDGKSFYSVLVRWNAIAGTQHRAEFITFKNYEVGTVVLLDVVTRYDKSAGRENVRVQVIDYVG